MGAINLGLALTFSAARCRQDLLAGEKWRNLRHTRAVFPSGDCVPSVPQVGAFSCFFLRGKGAKGNRYGNSGCAKTDTNVKRVISPALFAVTGEIVTSDLWSPSKGKAARAVTAFRAPVQTTGDQGQALVLLRGGGCCFRRLQKGQ